MSSLISARLSLLADRPRSVPQKLSINANFSSSTSESAAEGTGGAAAAGATERRLWVGAARERPAKAERALKARKTHDMRLPWVPAVLTGTLASDRASCIPRSPARSP